MVCHLAWPIHLDGAVLSGSILLAFLLRLEFQERERNRVPIDEEEKLKRVILVGAGRAGVLAVREIMSRADQWLQARRLPCRVAQLVRCPRGLLLEVVS